MSRVQAGGPVDGIVTGRGGEAQFCLGSACAKQRESTNANVTVQIHAARLGVAVKWNIDKGPVYGPYKNRQIKNETIRLSEGPFAWPMSQRRYRQCCLALWFKIAFN